MMQDGPVHVPQAAETSSDPWLDLLYGIGSYFERVFGALGSGDFEAINNLEFLWYIPLAVLLAWLGKYAIKILNDFFLTLVEELFKLVQVLFKPIVSLLNFGEWNSLIYSIVVCVASWLALGWVHGHAEALWGWPVFVAQSWMAALLGIGTLIYGLTRAAARWNWN